MARRRTAQSFTSSQPARHPSRDTKRFIPCNDGRHAYVIAPMGSTHVDVASDRMLEVVGAAAVDADEAAILAQQATALDEQYPGRGWDGVAAAAAAAVTDGDQDS